MSIKDTVMSIIDMRAHITLLDICVVLDKMADADIVKDQLDALVDCGDIICDEQGMYSLSLAYHLKREQRSLKRVVAKINNRIDDDLALLSQLEKLSIYLDGLKKKMINQ